MKKLMNHYGGKSTMPYVGAPKDFDRIAKEFHVDYAFHKVSPGHYLLFFKANQADAITAASSISDQLKAGKAAAEQAKAERPPKEKPSRSAER